MFRSNEITSVYPGGDQLPQISIGAGAGVDVQQIAELYMQANEALLDCFGQPLASGSIKRIYFSGHRGSKKPGETLGWFDDLRKSLEVYPNRIEQDARFTWQEIFSHELGHAYHGQLEPDSSRIDIPDAGCEAFAEMAVPVILTRCNQESIIGELAKWMRLSNRLLFGPATEFSRYPTFWERKQDSVQLFYLINQYGRDPVVDLILRTHLGVATKPNNVKDNISGFDIYSYRAQLMNLCFLNKFGVTRAQLFDDAGKWYWRYSLSSWSAKASVLV